MQNIEARRLSFSDFSAFIVLSSMLKILQIIFTANKNYSSMEKKSLMVRPVLSVSKYPG
jgi:hypothetical protein